MKIIYSQLKKLLPDIKKSAREVANDLTMLGHFSEGLLKSGKETVINLEVRQNRGDCLGYYGIAKDLSVLYRLPLVIPEIKLPKPKNNYRLPIKVKAKEETKRLIALRVSGIKNSPSPKWLKRFLNLHEINSINLVVDLTNWITLWYGIPCHAFDTRKSGNQLTWQLNQKDGQKFITLDGTEVKLKKNNFVISDREGVASLVMLGGKRASIDLNSTETIIEMAIYDRIKVRQDARELNITTEAGVRLEKDLDPELIPQAHHHLIQLVLKHCGGEITSNQYDYYPKKEAPKEIKLNLNHPSNYAGIKIPSQFSLAVLKSLGCQIKAASKVNLLITPPSLRKDLTIEEDLIEEIVRFFGYDKIPTNKPISSKQLPDITPKIIYFVEVVKEILVSLGYDEVRSWPLIQKKYFYCPKSQRSKTKAIYVQNSINEDFPILRQSIVSSLAWQKDQYDRYQLPQQQFFEIGRVFYQQEGKYCEHYSLGLYHYQKGQMENDLLKLSEKLGVKSIKDVPESFEGNDFIEINLEMLLKKVHQLPKTTGQTTKKSNAYELTSQILDLDANIVLPEKEKPEKIIKEYLRKIGPKHLWQLLVTDVYREIKTNRYKYTLKAYYFNTDDKTAKKIQLTKFGLKSNP